jgi:hypothetical protein
MKSKRNFKRNFKKTMRSRKIKKGGDDYRNSTTPRSSVTLDNNELNLNYEKQQREEEQKEINFQNEQREQNYPEYAKYANYQKELEAFQKQYDECCDSSGKNIKVKQFVFFSKNKCPKYNCDTNTSTIYNRIKMLKSIIEKIKKYQLVMQNLNRNNLTKEQLIIVINDRKNSDPAFNALDQELQQIWNNKQTPINDPNKVPNLPPKKKYFSSFTRKMPYMPYLNPSPSSQLKKIEKMNELNKMNEMNKNNEFGTTYNGQEQKPLVTGGRRTRRKYKNKNKGTKK